MFAGSSRPSAYLAELYNYNLAYHGLLPLASVISGKHASFCILEVIVVFELRYCRPESCPKSEDISFPPNLLVTLLRFVFG